MTTQTLFDDLLQQQGEIRPQFAPVSPTSQTKPKPEGAELWVICHTPAGAPLRIRARDAAHAEWLQRMNPSRETLITIHAAPEEYQHDRT